MKKKSVKKATKKSLETKNYQEDIFKLSILFISTFGLYGIYWTYRSWGFLKKEDSLFKDSSSMGKTIGCMIPLLNLIFFHDLFASIIDVVKTKKIKTSISPGGMLFLLIILGLFTRIHWTLFVLTVFVLVKFQKLINLYAEKTGRPRPEFHFEIWEYLVIAIGIMIWIIRLL